MVRPPLLQINPNFVFQRFLNQYQYVLNSFRAVRISETPVQEEDSNLEQVESPVDKSGLATAGPSETSTYLDPVDAAVR